MNMLFSSECTDFNDYKSLEKLSDVYLKLDQIAYVAYG